jgi:hypothetical protein
VASAAADISNTEDWLNWNGDVDNSNHIEDNCPADFQSDIEQQNHIGDPECPKQQTVGTAPNVSRLIQPTWKSEWMVEKVIGMVNAIETRRNKEGKKKLHWMRYVWVGDIS